MKNRKGLNKHDFWGECDPKNETYLWSHETFSVGIFKWISKASGKGLKKSVVVHRVKGSTKNPEVVYGKAGELCCLLDAGRTIKKKATVV